MAIKTFYTNSYPEIAAVINKKESSGEEALRNKMGYHGIITNTWEEAHEQLRNVAMKRLNKANEEYTKALEHAIKVFNMTNPDASKK